MTQVRVLVADNHEVARLGLRALLAARPGWEVVGEAADGHDAIRKAIELTPNVAILDCGLPIVGGLETARAIRARAPIVEVLILALHHNDGLIREVFEVGARGYLLKSDAKEDLYAAVESVAERRPFFTATVAKMLLESYLERDRQEEPLTNKSGSSSSWLLRARAIRRSPAS
jgi:DNA-binding NarL/FixJ family response regulator